LDYYPNLNDVCWVLKMDCFQRAYYEKAFLAEFLEKKGTTFQDFFSTIMEKAHPSDFQRIRPWGNQGDQKNDGYLKTTRTLFQVYAPNEMKGSEAISKIDEDFNGALPHWEKYFDKWVFVHNSRMGLGPEVEKKLLELESSNKQIKIENWGFEELRQILFSVEDADIASILGPAPSYQDISNVGYEEIKVLLGTIAIEENLNEDDVRPVPKEKVIINKLSSSTDVLLKGGMRKAHLVERFFNEWHDPNYGDRVATAFSDKYIEYRDQGLLPDAIFSKLQDFALGERRKEPRYEAAGYAILAYLFEQCDIFERTEGEKR